MRRLAVVTMGTTALMGIGPALAGITTGTHDRSWCEDNADAVARLSAGQADLVVGVGKADDDKPVQSAFACLDGEMGRRHVDAIVTGWVDTQYGYAGMSCARQPVEALTCKRQSLPLPGRASDPATSSRNEWQLKALGLGVGYDVGTSSAAATARADDACVGHDDRQVCSEAAEYRAWVRPADQPGAGAQDRSVSLPVPAAPGD